MKLTLDMLLFSTQRRLLLMMNHNEGIRDQICAAVSGLSSETLNRKPEGKWSAVFHRHS